MSVHKKPPRPQIPTSLQVVYSSSQSKQNVKGNKLTWNFLLCYFPSVLQAGTAQPPHSSTTRFLQSTFEEHRHDHLSACFTYLSLRTQNRPRKKKDSVCMLIKTLSAQGKDLIKRIPANGRACWSHCKKLCGSVCLPFLFFLVPCPFHCHLQSLFFQLGEQKRFYFLDDNCVLWAAKAKGTLSSNETVTKTNISRDQHMFIVI